jgi:hypothetical protein
VIMATYGSVGSGSRAVSSMALAVSFVRFLTSVPWLSKDIILLLSYGKELSTLCCTLGCS